MNNLKIFSIVVLSSLMIIGCTPPDQKEAVDETGTELVQDKQILVRTSLLEKSTISRTIDYNSTLQAYEEVYVAPGTPGRIEKIYVEPVERDRPVLDRFRLGPGACLARLSQARYG